MFLSEDYHLDTLQQEVVVSIMLAGAIVGGFLSGPMAGTNLGAPPNRQRKPPRASSLSLSAEASASESASSCANRTKHSHSEQISLDAG